MATGTLSPDARLQFFDNNGLVLNGGKLFTYVAGTTTALATYSDVGLSVANANPIILNASGRPSAAGVEVGVFLSPGASYKYVLQTSAGAAVWTQDNITSVPGSSANLDITGTAGEALTAGQSVYLSDGSGGKNAGQWYKGDSGQNYSSTLPEVGMVPASISSGQSGTIRLGGQMTGLVSLTVGASYYVSTGGAIIATAPTNRRLLGVADSTSTLILTPNPPQVIQHWVNDFRLTLTTALPITTADVLAGTTIFCTPLTGNRIDLPDSNGNPVRVTSAEFSIAVPATTSQMYDIFVYNNAGVATLELLAWTNDTTRATAVVRTTNGRYLKSGDNTRMYLGSFRTTTVSGQTEDSGVKRYLWNYYNRVSRVLQRYEPAASWNYTTATVRQANANVLNQVDIVTGIAESVIDLALTTAASGSTTASAGIGENSTTTYVVGTSVFINSSGSAFVVRLVKTPAVGRNFYSWNEWSTAVGTTSWNGAVAAVGSTITSGLIGMIQG